MSLDSPLPSTPRLRLRWLSVEDQSFYCDLYTDPAAMRLIAPPLDPASAEADFRRALRASKSAPTFPPASHGETPAQAPAHPFDDLPWSNGASPQQSLRAVAVWRDTSEAVALYGLDRWDRTGALWEMGVMAPRLAQGRGYAVEGMSALVDWLFLHSAQRVLLRCRPDNLAACRVARRMGFRGQVADSSEGPVMLWERRQRA